LPCGTSYRVATGDTTTTGFGGNEYVSPGVKGATSFLIQLRAQNNGTLTNATSDVTVDWIAICNNP
jgi:hypothetical protein